MDGFEDQLKNVGKHEGENVFGNKNARTAQKIARPLVPLQTNKVMNPQGFEKLLTKTKSGYTKEEIEKNAWDSVIGE